MGCGNSQYNQNNQVIDTRKQVLNQDQNSKQNKTAELPQKDEFKNCPLFIMQIFNVIQIIVKPPECLVKCKKKLDQLLGLLAEIKSNTQKASEIDNDFYKCINENIIEYRKYLDYNVKSPGLADKTNAFLDKLQPFIDQLLQNNIKDDKSDNFLTELKLKYKGKPGYKAWKTIFKNKIQMPKDQFVQKYATHNDVVIENTRLIADFIDSDKNNVISFEEFMTFIDNYKDYYDQKGYVIKELDMLMQRMQVETEQRNKKQIINDRKIVYAEEMIYEGDISNGMKHGKGKLYRGNEYLYEGDFCNDAKHGNGMEFKNQTRYEGQWQNNQKYGKGKITYNDGSYYEGDFKNDLCEGKGKLVLTNKTCYEGIFQENVMINGLIYYPTGERYEGQTKDNEVKHGHGKLYDASGKLVKEGNFQEDKPTQKYKYQYYEDKAELDKQAADITDLELDLEIPEGHDPLLLANTKSLKVLYITITDWEKVHENKELTVKLLQNIHQDSAKSLKELHINLPNEKEMKVDKIDFLQLFQQFPKFSNITCFDLQLKCWGANNLTIDGSVIEALVQTFQQFKNLTHLNLDLFSWGYLNNNLTHNDVVKLVQGIEYFSGQLVSLFINLGRWGCQAFGSYELMSDATLNSIGELLQQNYNLEEFGLNIRSWPYKNKAITNQGIQKLFGNISKLTNLKKLELNFRGMAYENDINQQTLVSLANAISNLVNMENLYINIQICDNFTDLEPLENAARNLSKVTSLSIQA